MLRSHRLVSDKARDPQSPPPTQGGIEPECLLVAVRAGGGEVRCHLVSMLQEDEEGSD
jgi:hypothetical protein